jgi:hypothetical protein
LAGERDIPIGPIVAGIGAVLLIVSLFLDWYDGVSGFTVFEFVDILLVCLALVTVFSLAGGLGLVQEAVSPAVSLAVALFTVFVVVVQILNDPPVVTAAGGSGKDIGIWLALAGGALMVAGALLSSTHISLAVEPRERRPRGGGVNPDATTRSGRADEMEGSAGSGRPLSDSERRPRGRPGGPPGAERP